MSENVTELIEEIKADVQRLQRSLFHLADKVSHMEAARTYDEAHRRRLGACCDRGHQWDGDSDGAGFIVDGQRGAPALAVCANGVDRRDATA